MAKQPYYSSWKINIFKESNEIKATIRTPRAKNIIEFKNYNKPIEKEINPEYPPKKLIYTPEVLLGVNSKIFTFNYGFSDTQKILLFNNFFDFKYTTFIFEEKINNWVIEKLNSFAIIKNNKIIMHNFSMPLEVTISEGTFQLYNFLPVKFNHKENHWDLIVDQERNNISFKNTYKALNNLANSFKFSWLKSDLKSPKNLAFKNELAAPLKVSIAPKAIFEAYYLKELYKIENTSEVLINIEDAFIFLKVNYYIDIILSNSKLYNSTDKCLFLIRPLKLYSEFEGLAVKLFTEQNNMISWLKVNNFIAEKFLLLTGVVKNINNTIFGIMCEDLLHTLFEGHLSLKDVKPHQLNNSTFKDNIELKPIGESNDE